MIKSKINEIDTLISAFIPKLKTITDEMEFIEQKQFVLSESNVDLLNLNYSGVYLFEIEVSEENVDFINWLTSFREKWESDVYYKKFTPSIKNKRIVHHMNKKMNRWIPLYIGKSRNISKRIYEHINLPIDKTTFALKLRSRKNLHGIKFKVSTIEINVINYDSIVSLIEINLRNRLNPIVGKQ